jgi:hypothetical protein
VKFLGYFSPKTIGSENSEPLNNEDINNIKADPPPPTPSSPSCFQSKKKTIFLDFLAFDKKSRAHKILNSGF